ncbi:hypothetical protein ACHAXT_009744 [Thalassiosira profunda]
MSSPPRRSSRRKGAGTKAGPLSLDQKWRPLYRDLGHCRILRCRQRLMDASDKELDGLRSMCISFVALAIAAAGSTSGKARVAKERELLAYVRTAKDCSLPLNDDYDGKSAVELAAYHGLKDVLAFLLDEGCPLKKTGRSHAVHAAVRNGQHAALDVILTERKAEARRVLREEVTADGAARTGNCSTLWETIVKSDDSSAWMLLTAGCLRMSDIDAKMIFSNPKLRRHLQLRKLLKLLYPSIPNVMHWRGELHWSFPTTDRQTMNWLWHAVHRQSNAFPDESYECVPMTESITKLNAAKPPHPIALACGPCFACIAAPVMHPLTTAFHTSCFPRYFSTKHSDPPNTPVMKANWRHQYMDLSAVARNVVRICSFSGAWGTSFPSIIVTGGVMSVKAPIKTPINNPITPPPITPMAAFPPHDSDSQLKFGGSWPGAALAVVHGWGYGRERMVSAPNDMSTGRGAGDDGVDARPSSSGPAGWLVAPAEPYKETGRCSAASAV